MVEVRVPLKPLSSASIFLNSCGKSIETPRGVKLRAGTSRMGITHSALAFNNHHVFYFQIFFLSVFSESVRGLCPIKSTVKGLLPNTFPHFTEPVSSLLCP
jgi:hypothetical protein